MRHLLRHFMLPLKQIDAALPKQGLIFDLGCGEGVVSTYLAKSSSRRQIVGIDTNAQRLAKTKKLPNLNFKNGDIVKVDLTYAQGCLISDVFHHLSLLSQSQLLAKFGRELKPGSICVIKEINSDDMIRSKLSLLWDWLLYPQDKINYWPARKLSNTMKKLGFKVKFYATTHWFPGSTTLFICTKT